ncbi:MAG: ATP synthase subunit I [Gammaproteobacteria bacterium]|nr:ATP synthase subunit I [Gammaproteobacteria bacterium]
MCAKPLPRVRREMSRILLYQFLIILAVILIILLLAGRQKALSVSAGALSYWLPTAFFIWIFSIQGNMYAGMNFLAKFIVGESVKLFVCGTLFIVFVKYLPIQILDAVIGLGIAIVAFWLASLALVFKKGVGT